MLHEPGSTQFLLTQAVLDRAIVLNRKREERLARAIGNEFAQVMKKVFG